MRKNKNYLLLKQKTKKRKQKKERKYIPRDSNRLIVSKNGKNRKELKD